MSPIFATALPKRSSSDNVGPFVVVSSITTVAFVRPFPGSSSMNKMYNAPLSSVPPQQRFAPTAKSLIPSPLRSPMFAMESPKRSTFLNVGPFGVK